ncbi:MAG TPA: nickel-responsive transcriptional regulator NikR [Armatimonadota bacterium]|nr:nickel-responsive transcriptional regulator NikR [Armatimonadota bacterium]
MPDTVARFTISVPPELLSTFDEVCAGKGYVSRSEAVRDALRDYLVAHEWSVEHDAQDVVGTITLLYDEDVRHLSGQLLDQEHQDRTHVLSSLHVHLDSRTCLDVVVVRGSAAEVTALADRLISLRGVKHGRLVAATAGTELP